MKNPALILSANSAIQAIMSQIYQSGISSELLEYVGLRVGQMNNCELCIGQSFLRAETSSSVKDRIEHVLDWKTSTVFSEAERTALEVTEKITELEDKYNSVPNALWTQFENYYSEKERAALVLYISMMNMFTRINVATRQLTPDWEQN